jgi:hypothetical protein
MAESASDAAPDAKSGTTSDTASGPLSFRAAAGIIAAGLFVSGLGWPGMIARLPLDLFLKNQLHFPAQHVAAFWAIGAFAWYVKPLVALLCDAYPLLGTRRRGYLVAGSVAACLLWSALAFVPARPLPLLSVMLALNLAIVAVSTAIGGLLVEVGQRHGATGRLSALREGLIGAMALVVGPIAGWLAGRAIGWTAGTGAMIWLGFIPVALWAAAREPPATSGDGRRVLAGAVAQLRILRRAPTMWRAAGLLFFVYLAPGFQTPLLYHQQDDLHFTPQIMGRLLLVGAMGAIAGSAAYGWLCRRVPLRVLLVGGIVLNTVSTLFYLAYASLAAATAITLAAALLGSIAVLPIYDLAARATPRGSESFGYALLMSVQTLTTLAISDPLGATLYGHFHVAFPSLVWINAASTAAVLLFVPFLPRALVAARDRSAAP